MSAYDSAYRAQPAYDLNPFNISGSSRSRSSSLANLHTTNAATIPATSADVHGDIGVLERENFDLKLRLFYLEEKLKHTGTETQVQLVDLEMELQNKNKAIVEKEEEIEGKNVLLVKARQAIETLQGQNFQLQQEKHAELQSIEEGWMDKLDKIKAVHAQDINARQSVYEQQAHALEQLNASLDHAEHKLSEYTDEIKSLSSALQSRSAELVSQQHKIEQNDKDWDRKLDHALDTLRSQTVPLSQHSALQLTHQRIEQEYSTLQHNMAEWKAEILKREEYFSGVERELAAKKEELKNKDILVHENEILTAQVVQRGQEIDMLRIQANNDRLHIESSHKGEMDRLGVESERQLKGLQEQLKEQMQQLVLAYEDKLHNEKIAHMNEMERERRAEEERRRGEQMAQAQILAQANEKLERTIQSHDAELRRMERDHETRIGEMRRGGEEREERVKAELAKSEERRREEGRAAQLALDSQRDEYERKAALVYSQHEEDIREYNRAIEESRREREEREREMQESVQMLQTTQQEYILQLNAEHTQAVQAAQAAHIIELTNKSKEMENVIAELSKQHETILEDIEVQWFTKQQELTAQCTAQLNEAKKVQSMLEHNIHTLNELLHGVESERNSEYVLKKKLDEALVQIKDKDDSIQSLHVQLAHKVEEIEIVRVESAPIAKLHEVQDVLENKERELTMLREHIQRLQNANPVSNTTSAASPAPPSIPSILFTPSRSPSSSRSSSPSKYALVPISNTNNNEQLTSISVGVSEREHGALKQQCRTLELQIKQLSLQLQQSKKRAAESREIIERDWVKKSLYAQLADGLALKMTLLAQTQQQLFHARQLILQANLPLSSSSSSSPLPLSLQRQAQEQGIGIVPIDDEQHDSLSHELSRLQRDIRARDTEIASLSSQLHQHILSNQHNLHEQNVYIAQIGELEKNNEALQSELSERTKSLHASDSSLHEVQEQLLLVQAELSGMGRMYKELQGEMGDMKEAYGIEKSSILREHDSHIQQLLSTHQREIGSIQDEAERRVDKKETEVRSVKESMVALKREEDIQKKELQDKHESILSQLQQQHQAQLQEQKDKLAIQVGVWNNDARVYEECIAKLKQFVLDQQHFQHTVTSAAQALLTVTAELLLLFAPEGSRVGGEHRERENNVHAASSKQSGAGALGSPSKNTATAASPMPAAASMLEHLLYAPNSPFSAVYNQLGSVPDIAQLQTFLSSLASPHLSSPSSASSTLFTIPTSPSSSPLQALFATIHQHFQGFYAQIMQTFQRIKKLELDVLDEKVASEQAEHEASKRLDILQKQYITVQQDLAGQMDIMKNSHAENIRGIEGKYGNEIGAVMKSLEETQALLSKHHIEAKHDRETLNHQHQHNIQYMQHQCQGYIEKLEQWKANEKKWMEERNKDHEVQEQLIEQVRAYELKLNEKSRELEREREAVVQLRHELNTTSLELNRTGTQLQTMQAVSTQYSLLKQDQEVVQKRASDIDRRAELLQQEKDVAIQLCKKCVVEVAHIIYAAKIPASSYTDSSVYPPAFLNHPTIAFRFPEDIEMTLKWIKSKMYEFQRIRRAFQFTIAEVEEKWKGQFGKITKLLEQRGEEIAALQRKTLHALGNQPHSYTRLHWR